MCVFLMLLCMEGEAHTHVRLILMLLLAHHSIYVVVSPSKHAYMYVCMIVYPSGAACVLAWRCHDGPPWSNHAAVNRNKAVVVGGGMLLVLSKKVCVIIL